MFFSFPMKGESHFSKFPCTPFSFYMEYECDGWSWSSHTAISPSLRKQDPGSAETSVNGGLSGLPATLELLSYKIETKAYLFKL